MENRAENMHQNLFLILVDNPKQPLHATNSFENIRYSERGLAKSLRKVNFIFSFEPSPF